MGEHSSGVCVDVSYLHRVDDPAEWNWCLVPDGGYDAVFFAAMAIMVMAIASPRWDALISLVAGGIYEVLSYEFNLGHVSNASALWLGMRPADIFVYVFLPPFLLDLAVRIDFFMLKKMIVNIIFMAFAMVITTCLILIPFMLYALDLKSSGWTASYVALFGAAIASTDAAAVCASLSAGGAPEILAVMLEGESLFNDASSLTLFEIFKELVTSNESKPLGDEISHIIVKTLETALVGVAIGLAMGIFTKYIFVWLQYRNMPAAMEVGFTVGGAYASFFITQVWCHGSGCVGTVAYGLYGSATLLWGMSNKTRQSGIFQNFWAILTFLVNALIFFYVGASCVNFTIRSANQLYSEGGAKSLISVTLYKLPIIYVYVFAVRAIFLLIVFKIVNVLRIGGHVTWRQCLFLALGGIRGSLSLVLAQTIATLASTSSTNDERVKAEAAMYAAGFVIMTLIINAPLSAPAMTLLKLNTISKEQLLMRGHVKQTFHRFTATALEELQAEAQDDDMLQGVDWTRVELATDFQEVLDKQLPEVQPSLQWGEWFFPLWLRAWLWKCGFMCTHPHRLLRKNSAQTAEEAAEVEEERQAAREQRERLKGELSRMTAISIKQQQGVAREGSRTSLPRGSSPISRSTTAQPATVTDVLIIKDPSVHGNDSGLLSPSRSLRLAGSHSTLQRAKSSRNLGSEHRGMGSFVRGFMAQLSPHRHKRAEPSRHKSMPPGALTSPRAEGDFVKGVAGEGPDVADEAEHQVVSDPVPGLAAPPAIKVSRTSPDQTGQVGTAATDASGSSPSMPSLPEHQGLATASGALDPYLVAEASEEGSRTTHSQQASPTVAAAGAGGSRRSLHHRSASASSPRHGGPSRLQVSSSALNSDVPAPASAQERPSDHAQGPLPPSLSGDVLHHSKSSGELPSQANRSSPLHGARSAGGAANVTRDASSGGLSGDDAIQAAISAADAELGTMPSLGASAPETAPSAGSQALPARVPPSQYHTSTVHLVEPLIELPSFATSLGTTASASSPLPSLGTSPGAAADSTMVPLEVDGSMAVGAAAAPPAAGAVDAGAEAQQRGSPDRPLVFPSLTVTQYATSSVAEPSPTNSVHGAAAGGGAMRGSLVTPGSDAFLAHATSSLLVINAAKSMANAQSGLFPNMSSFLQPDMQQVASTMGGAETEHTQRIVQRIGGDGMLATTSVHAVPRGKTTALGRSSMTTTTRSRIPNTQSTPGEASAPETADALARRSAFGGQPMGGISEFQVPPEVSDGPLSAIVERDASSLTPAGEGGAGLGNKKVRTAGGGLGRASLGSRFFSQETERSMAHQGTSLSQTENSPFVTGTLGGGNLATTSKTNVPGTPSATLGVAERSLAARSKASIRKASLAAVGAASHHAPQPDKPLIVRDSQELIRSSRTGAPLMRLSRMSNNSKLYTDAVGGPEEQARQMTMEYRLRLLTGLKQYYRAKYLEGILSAPSYKMLWYITNKAHHHPELPLPLWQLAQKEVSSSKLLTAEAHCYYWIKARFNRLKTSSSWLNKHLLSRLLSLPVWLLSAHLSRVQLAGLEAAMELWISLTGSLQTQWLQYSGPYGAAVLQEVHENADGVWRFIVDRRIEAPKKFQAIQTYRATVHLLSQQLAFVQEMSHGGMIDESEAVRMEDSMHRRLQRVCRSGPQWRRQSVAQILAGVPFLRTQHPKVLAWIRKHSTIKLYQQGECIWEHWSGDAGPPKGMFIVISGVVRMQMQVQRRMQSVYLGSGGVGGLLSMVLDDDEMPAGVGLRAAYAEGHAMGKGPVVMHIPRELFVAIQRLSREERLATWQQLELSIFRTAAGLVLDMLREQVLNHLGLFVRAAMASCVCSERLDSKIARRNRIRAILKEALDAEGGEGGNTLDWVHELLNVPKQVSLALLDGSLDFSLATQPWHKAMFQALAASTAAVFDLIRAAVRDSCLVVMAPGQTIWQSSTMVLIQGSLGEGGPEVQPRADSPGGPLGSLASALGSPPAGAGRPDHSNTALPPALTPLHAPSAPTTGTEFRRSQPSSPMKQAAKTNVTPSSEWKHKLGGPANRGLGTAAQAAAPNGGFWEGAEAVAPRAKPQSGFVATPNESHIAPSVMVWIADYYDVEVPTQRAVPLVAGSKGACLLVYSADPATILTGNTSLF